MINLVSKFVDRLTAVLAIYGFAYEGNNPFFSSKKDDVNKVIGLDISSFADRYTVAVNILIRNNKIAKILEAFDRAAFKGEYYFTVRTNQYWVADLYARPEYKIPSFILRDQESLIKSVNEVEGFMKEVGIHFFNRFKHIEDFDLWFNKAVLEGTYDFKLGNAGSNAIEGLVAAKLTNNVRFNELYEIWVAGLGGAGKFSKTVEKLKSLKLFLNDYQ